MSNPASYEERLQNFDWSLAERELGYAPKTRLEDGLAREVEWVDSLYRRFGPGVG